ncbi:MAG TPA: glutathione transferase [Methylophilus sp.]|nr:glutathione transferase [Methylophilus sp.]
MMILYVDANYLSPYAMSAYIALREKGLEFEVRLVNLRNKEQALPEYGRVSSTQRVPTLVDSKQNFNLSESSAITEYIDEQYSGTPLYPLDIQSKAKARELQAWLRSDLLPIREERSTEVVFLTRSPPPLSAQAQTAANKLLHAAAQLLQPGQTHLFGDWSIADTDLAVMINRLVLAGDPVPEHLLDYAELQWQRPSVRKWVNLPRELLKY